MSWLFIIGAGIIFLLFAAVITYILTTADKRIDDLYSRIIGHLLNFSLDSDKETIQRINSLSLDQALKEIDHILTITYNIDPQKRSILKDFKDRAKALKIQRISIWLSIIIIIVIILIYLVLATEVK